VFKGDRYEREEWAFIGAPLTLPSFRDFDVESLIMDVTPTHLIGLLGLLVFAGLMLWAAIWDVQTFTITNKLNLVIAASFLVLAVPMGLGWPVILDHIKVAVIASIVAMIMFYIGIYGGGDFKMTGAIALWLGSAPMVPFILYTAIAGGALGLSLIIGRKLAKTYGLPKSPKWARQLLRKRSAVPYGVALGVGALLAAPGAVWFPHNAFQ
jgi:prepilin peptidase CpaA